jgi:predicted cupin superfamily sugar epimerase
MTRGELIAHFKMTPHPEGGAFVQNYRSGLEVSAAGFPGPRPASTGIYFLLGRGEFSAFHRIRSDEMWHFYLGGALHIVEIDPAGQFHETTLGRDIHEGQFLTHVVRAGNWFASHPAPGSEISLVGCTVAPGFDFQDFELADRQTLVRRFPEHERIIVKLTRDGPGA